MPAAHVDQCDVELGFVVDQDRQAGRIGRGHHGFDRQVAALDGENEVAGRRGIAADDMHIGAELVADHPLGIADAADAVEREAGRQRVKDGTALAGHGGAGRLQHPMDVIVGDRLAAHRDLGAVMLRREPAARHVDDDAGDLHARHAFRRIDGQPDGAFGFVHVDDRAALDAAGALMADPEDAAAVRPPRKQVRGLGRRQLGDQAGDLRRADIEHAEQGALAHRQWTHPARHETEAHVGFALALGLLARAAARSAAASSESRAVIRPGIRRSIDRDILLEHLGLPLDV